MKFRAKPKGRFEGDELRGEGPFTRTLGHSQERAPRLQQYQPRDMLELCNVGEGGEAEECCDTYMKEIALEENAFGGVAMILTGTSISGRLGRCHLWLLLLSSLALQATFSWLMIPLISKDVYAQKITQDIVDLWNLEKDERVCNKREGMVDLRNFHQHISPGVCGVVAEVDEISNIVYFDWDNHQNSSLPMARWSRQVRLENPSLSKFHSTSNLFKVWRETDVDGAATSYNKTWAEWACIGEDWSWVESQIDNYAKYSAPNGVLKFMNQGQLFGLITLFLWSATIVQGIRSAFDFVLLAHCKATLECNSRLEDHEIDAFSTCLKTVVVFVFLGRVAVLATLCHQGVLFICYTDNLKDFILNSLALSFVVEIPNLLFNAFASDSEKAAIKEFNESSKFKVPVFEWFKRIPGAVWVTCALLCVIAGATVLIPFAERLHWDVYRQLCASEAGIPHSAPFAE